MLRLRQYWGNLRASFWFVPSLIIMLSVLLAILLVEVDSSGTNSWMDDWPRLFGAGPEGARGMLSTIAGSMMTVVGVTFSMTLVTLVLAASQYTSRILRNFMRDRITQIVLGIFAGIFTYCLIVLRTVRGGEDFAFIPSLAVTFGFVLAIAGINVLIFFIHHIASSIQAANIVASVAADTIEAVERLFPQRMGQPPPDETDAATAHPVPNFSWVPVLSSRDGYIQSVDGEALMQIAREKNCIIKMERGIGEFVVRKSPLLSVSSLSAADEETARKLQSAYSLHRYRTLEQDAGFGIRQLVDIALRALSPGINDTTTAILCLDYLTTILARLTDRDIPSAQRYDKTQLRVISLGPTFRSLLGESFDQIRRSSDGNATVMLKIIESISIIGGMTPDADRRLALVEQLHEVAGFANRSLPSENDKKTVKDEIMKVQDGLFRKVETVAL